MKTNVLLAGIVLGLILVLANLPLIGAVVFGLALILFFLRNGGLAR